MILAHKKEVTAGIKFFPSGDEHHPSGHFGGCLIEDVENFRVLQASSFGSA
jgi:hypothetical protein